MPGPTELTRYCFQAMDPTRQAHYLRQRFIELANFRIEKVVIRIADVTTNASALNQRILDRRAVVRKHAAERDRQTSVVENRSEEVNIFSNRFKRTRRIQQHESVLPHQ